MPSRAPRSTSLHASPPPRSETCPSSPGVAPSTRLRFCRLRVLSALRRDVPLFREASRENSPTGDRPPLPRLALFHLGDPRCSARGRPVLSYALAPAGEAAAQGFEAEDAGHRKARDERGRGEELGGPEGGGEAREEEPHPADPAEHLDDEDPEQAED